MDSKNNSNFLISQQEYDEITPLKVKTGYIRKTTTRRAWNKGKKASEEQKQKQSEKMKGRTSWNKGLTKETSDGMRRVSEFQMGHAPHVTEESIRKGIETKRKRKHFNTSKKEDRLYNQLCEQYGIEMVRREYNEDPRYPYRCDFYIISEDLFIEFNGTAEHNYHPFDPTSEDDLKELEKFKSKVKEKGPNSRYVNIIRWWTEIDPLKLKTLRDNKLNFMLIYPKNLIITK